MKKKKSPQEKKTLSYERDRRNMYGQSVHAARNAIPKRKRKSVRSYRKKASQLFPKVQPAAILKEDDSIEESLGRIIPKSWRKSPDMPLGAALGLRNERNPKKPNKSLQPTPQSRGG